MLRTFGLKVWNWTQAVGLALLGLCTLGLGLVALWLWCLRDFDEVAQWESRNEAAANEAARLERLAQLPEWRQKLVGF